MLAIIFLVLLICRTCSALSFANEICKCPRGADTCDSPPQKISLRTSEGGTVTQKRLEGVTFKCYNYYRANWIFRECYPSADDRSVVVKTDARDFEFMTKDGVWYKIDCDLEERPYIKFADFVSEACFKDKDETPTEIKPPAPKQFQFDGAKFDYNHATIPMKFKCSHDNKQITKCLAAGDPKFQGIDAGVDGVWGGESGKRFSIVCHATSKPTITERFWPEICAPKYPIATVQEQGNTVDTHVVTFACKDGKIARCYPPGVKQPPKEKDGVAPGSPALKFGGLLFKEYKLVCKAIDEPIITKN